MTYVAHKTSFGLREQLKVDFLLPALEALLNRTP